MADDRLSQERGFDRLVRIILDVATSLDIDKKTSRSPGFPG